MEITYKSPFPSNKNEKSKKCEFLAKKGGYFWGKCNAWKTYLHIDLRLKCKKM